MTTITIPRETFDQMREALMSNVKALDAVYQAVNDGYLEDKVLMPAIKASEAAISAAKAVQPQAQGEDKLRETVATVLEGWTLPDGVRKMLETAYWSHPQASEPAAPEATK